MRAFAELNKTAKCSKKTLQTLIHNYLEISVDGKKKRCIMRTSLTQSVDELEVKSSLKI